MGKLVDITGQKYGRLTVLKRAENMGKETAWECRCECGNISTVQGGHLKAGRTKSCGCLPVGRKLVDITGKTYGHLTVLKRAENMGKKTAWECQCDCGNISTVLGMHLRSGATKSCGCGQSRAASLRRGIV